jgi:hypothetical protein
MDKIESNGLVCNEQSSYLVPMRSLFRAYAFTKDSSFSNSTKASPVVLRNCKTKQNKILQLFNTRKQKLYNSCLLPITYVSTNMNSSRKNTASFKEGHNITFSHLPWKTSQFHDILSVDNII